MKKIFIAILAVAATAACNKAEVVSVAEGEAIVFGQAFVDNVTKATTATDPSYGASNALTSFNLWGTVNDWADAPVAIYADDTVTGTVGSTGGTVNVWNCTTRIQYWIEGAKYNFAAVVNGTVTAENGLPKTIDFTSDGSTDLLYARSKVYTGQASDNPLVNFDFAHLLAKVKFTLSNTTSNAENVGVYKYSITNVKITNAITKGIYTVADVINNDQTTYNIGGSWAATTTDGQKFDSIEKVENGGSSECASEKLLIPITNAAVSFNLLTYYGDSLIKTESKTATVADLKAGYSYNLIVSVGLNQEIQFSVESQPAWTNAPATELL